MPGTYSKELMIGLAVGFIIIPSIFVALRILAKWSKGNRLRLDDWLCFGSLAVGITCSVLQLYAAIDGQLGQHQSTGPDGQPILDDPRFLTKFAVNVISPIGFGFVKASILVLYKTIFQHIRPFRWAVYGMLTIVVIWAVSFFFANLFTCLPITPLIEPFYGNKCVDTYSLWLSVLVTDLIVDVGILIMPIPLVLRLHLPWKDRLGVLGMFLLGTIVVAISIARLVQSLEVAAEFGLHYNDETYYTSPIFFWANIELAVAIVSSCLPTLRPLWIYLFPTSPTTTQKTSTQYIQISDPVRQGGKDRDSVGECQDDIPLTDRGQV
ncbi:hypothetical protein TruAng_002199 [Truncatella angustata]|nr:hypothetical protein TruAng_002199 [Truncatella angustata]